jgi:putative glutamine amidotransferase
VPIIAITACSKLHDYEESIRRAGGEPHIIDVGGDRPADVLAQVDGVLLTGGGDVDPALYGEPKHPAFDAAEAGRDAFEIDLVRRTLDADVPLFAICRGIQVLNVARGGSLVQDIADQVPGTVGHTRREPSFAIAHDVWINDGTLLDRLLHEQLETDTCPVNSRHHQAVKTVGEGLVVTATAPDGIIESIEDPGRRFCLGVQWHPENFYRTGEFRALFAGFVEAAAKKS